MKWSELFAGILGEKDVEVGSSPSPSSNSQTQSNSQVEDSVGNKEATAPVTSESHSSQSQQNNGTQQTGVQNLTQSQFDALNAKIAELEAANRELLLNGASQNQTPEATPESLIYSLCVERNGHGKQSTKNSSNAAER